jgi:hypothetical protein
MGHLYFLSDVLSGSGTVTLGAVLLRFDSSLGKYTHLQTKAQSVIVIHAAGMIIKNM